MEIKLINVGFGNIIAAQRIVAIVGPDSAPIKRIVQESRERGLVIDMTCGRRTRSVLILDTGHVALAAIMPDTLVGRFNQSIAGENESDLELGEESEL